MENAHTRNITGYFRDAVAAQKLQQIEITEESIKTEMAQVAQGRIDATSALELVEKYAHKPARPEEDDFDGPPSLEELRSIPVFMAARVVNIRREGGVQHAAALEDLTCVYYLPAILYEDGILRPDSMEVPWFPREYLHPILDNVLAVGHVKNVDGFIASHIKEVHDMRENADWTAYYQLAKDFWQAVNGSEMDGDVLLNHLDENQPLQLDGFVYIIPDNTVSATHHIKKLYEYALTEEKPANLLYQKLVELQSAKPEALAVGELAAMEAHRGQMGDAYPLSASQREAMNHFGGLQAGQILAVNGPPGTGKTTLLQSVVANLMVERALRKADAPIIVASSTNNQAVTNIIESFASIDGAHHFRGLDEHWIPRKRSFATYFPSRKKAEEARKKGYQITSQRMDYSVAEWEEESHLEEATGGMLSRCATLFGGEFSDLHACEGQLHTALHTLDKTRYAMLVLAGSLPFPIQLKARNTLTALEEVQAELLQLQERDQQYRTRLAEWQKCFKQLLLYRIFKFIPSVRKRLEGKINNFRSLEETALTAPNLCFADIEAYYGILLEDNRQRYDGYKSAIEILRHAETLLFLDIDPLLTSEGQTLSLMPEALDRLFDTTLRYYAFWLAVHYFECRWLAGECKTKPEELFKSTIPVLHDKYKRLCMLTPCLVMTFYMLPSFFCTYSDKYLYDFIDLLIVDEAGQVSPEIGAASFLLAKKALVVGDVHQIEPVWNISRGLDISLASDRGVIPADQFADFEKSGLHTSGASLMKAACKASHQEKFGEKGLLLTEHRRCYDEIICYCNELVYGGNLEPLRGNAQADKKYPFPDAFPLAHIQIDTAHSEKRGTSRYNTAEAAAILRWIATHFSGLQQAYPGEGAETLLGVITPFKAQADAIRRQLKNHPDARLLQAVSVGTVHTFQGGERRVILFSSVYGAEDGCAFLDAKKNLMNVALSRAKDRFIVFGDSNCLSHNTKQPSGLLRKHLRAN